MAQENKRELKKEDQINISLFNSLEGLNRDTLRVINDKISEIKEIC